MSQSTKRRPKAKAKGLPSDFPLWLQPSGRWCKKIKQRVHYFGKADDPQGALSRYLAERTDLEAGRTFRQPDSDELTVRDLCNEYLTVKERLLESGDIVQRTFRAHREVCGRTIGFLGRARLVADLRPEDFARFRGELARNFSPVTLKVAIGRVRVVFGFAYDEGLVKSSVRFGQGFRAPSKRSLLQVRHERGSRMFEAAEIKTLLAKANVHLKAIIHLGVNCGFGPHDVGRLPESAVDLELGWVDFPRPKTGVFRRIPLWSETVSAIRESVRQRRGPTNATDKGLLFVTVTGRAWANDSPNNAVTSEFRKLLEVADLHRPGLGFYGLRRTFETIAGESIDQVAVDHIMGHSRGDMASVYRQRISDERLLAVVNHVRPWLFPADDSLKE